MRKYFLILLCCLFSVSLHAQSDIVAMEYFIDVDPGVGLATSVPVTSGAVVDINISVPTTTLSEGFHTIHFRTQNADGLWSFYESRGFLVQNTDPLITPTPEDIVAIEYFIDDDPGQGAAQSVSITSGQIVDFSMLVSSNLLPTGFHTISYRAQDALGIWGFYETRVFYIQPPVDPSLDNPIITDLEYFFDDDPGQGNATVITGITSGAVIDIQRLIPNTLTGGWHTFNVRARDDNGNWGFTETRVVYVEASGSVTTTPSRIDRLEYFYGDTDPGLGMATQIDIDPNTDNVDIASILLPTEPTLPVGDNMTITMRAQNEEGLWGFNEVREFDVIDDCSQPTASFTVNLACAGETVEFIDTSTAIQGDAEYRWYLDGDEVVDDLTTGNVSFTYANPGTYQVALAISQGQICYDSIFMDVVIKAKPIVVFNADRVDVGNATQYVVDQFNVDGTFSWDWDFETDAIIDDNTVGNTNFTFPAASAYLTTLRVFDGLGCEMTFSRSVTVDPVSSGGGPNANFQANTVCLGEVTLMSDLSTDIPPGSSYSWDFNNDGLEDDNTEGSTQFTYPTAGNYTAQLTIDTGSEILTSSQLISVINNPLADFEAMEICLGSSMTVTDLSTNISGSTIYSWDFDGDGIEDSSSSGDQSFTYTSSGVFSIVLTLDNGSGCSDTHVETVTVISQPTADFSLQQACAGAATTFLNQSTNLSGGVAYAWDFDDDGLVDSTLPNPSYVFPSSGTFDVSLQVDNGAGCMTDVIQTVTISEAPVVDFSSSNDCNSLEISFSDNSTAVDPAATYSWDFDNDGLIDSNDFGNTSFTYPASGTYIANLTIENGPGCFSNTLRTITVIDSPVASFDVQGGCANDLITFVNSSVNLQSGASYSWDFDNDAIEDSANLNPSTSFPLAGSYLVSLTVQNPDGCNDTFSETVIINEIPSVDFTVDAGCLGEVVTFINTSTGIESGALVEWDFTNDGIVDSNDPTTTTFTYPDAGPYSVSLTITNGSDCSAQSIKQVNFNNAAIAGFEFSNACLGEVTVFTDVTTGTSNSATYSWDFDGDGLEDSNVPGSTSFEYSSSGLYNASLTVNNNGCETTFSTSVEIFDLPELDLPDQLDLCEGEIVTIGPGPGFASYLWSDGSTNQTLVASTEGDYSLTVTDQNGCQSSDVVSVRESLLPIADFALTYLVNEESITIITQNLSENAESYSWDFGDGASSDEFSPEYTYADINILFGAVYQLCLTATNSCNSSTVCQEVNLTVTDRNELAEQSLRIYPNPSSGHVTIKLPTDIIKEQIEVNILSVSGQVIWSEQTSNEFVEIDQLAIGSYFVEIKSGSFYHIEKLMVK